MNFLDVVKGIQEGNVYRHKDFSQVEYLVLNSYDEIKLFDGWHNIQSAELVADQVLSHDWEKCEKHTWYIRHIEEEVNLVSDEVYYSYTLLREDKEFDTSWEHITLSLEELLHYQQYVTLQISAYHSFEPTEKTKIQQFLTGMHQEHPTEYISSKTTPAYSCDVIFEQKEEGYHVVKSTYGYPFYGGLVEDYKEYMHLPIRICVRQANNQEKYRYNFDVEQI